MYYNASYMNPIMQGLNQPAQPQQGIASLGPQIQDNNAFPAQPIPTQPSQPLDPQMTTGIETLDRSQNLFHNQEFIDPGVGQFNPPSSAFPDPSAPTDQFGNTIGWNPPPINMFPSQPPGYQPPGVQPGPGMGTFDHLTDNPYVQGQPDDFITIEGVRHYGGGAQQATPPPPQNFQPAIPQPGTGELAAIGQKIPFNPQPGIPFNPNPGTPYGVNPPQTNYSPGVMPPGWQDQQQFNPNQGIASLAGTNPGI